MTNSNLVIQVPFRSQALELKKEFDKRGEGYDVKIFHGSLSDTYGVAIDFNFWFNAPYQFNLVLLEGSIYRRITGEDWMDGRYLEAWEDDGLKEAIEIPFTELTTKGAKYYVDDIYLDLGTRKIYAGRDPYDILLMTTTDISLLTGRENLIITKRMMTGIEKLWRRGFLDIFDNEISALRGYYECQRKI